MKKSLAVKLSIIAGVIIFAVSGILIYLYVIKPKGNDSQKTVSVIIITDDTAAGTHEFIDYKTNAALVSDLLIELNSNKNIGLKYTVHEIYGMNITELYGVPVGDNSYYAFYLGDGYAPAGQSATEVVTGALYKFIYTTF